MDTLPNRLAQRSAQRAASGSSTPYDPAGEYRGAFQTLTASLDFPSVAANATQTLAVPAPSGLTLTVNGVVEVGRPAAAPAGLAFDASVTAGGASLTVIARNTTGAAIDPPALPFTFRVFK